MHDRVITTFEEWAEANLPPRVDRSGALQSAADARLDQMTIEVIESLPERAYDKADLIHVVSDGLVLKLGKASTTMRGFGGSS